MALRQLVGTLEEIRDGDDVISVQDKTSTATINTRVVGGYKQVVA